MIVFFPQIFRFSADAKHPYFKAPEDAKRPVCRKFFGAAGATEPETSRLKMIFYVSDIFARFFKMSELELKRKVDEIVDDDVECSNKKTVVDQEIGNTF